MQRPAIENRSYKVPHKKKEIIEREGREGGDRKKKDTPKIRAYRIWSIQNKQIPRGKGAKKKKINQK